MPELPEVETVRNKLKRTIVGKKIIDVKAPYDRILEDGLLKFRESVINQRINDIDRMGKFLIFKLDDIAFVAHMRMEGKWAIVERDSPLQKHEHVQFILDDNLEFRYKDTRKFGRMKLVSLNNYAKEIPLSKLGQEPFNADPMIIFSKLKNKNQPIKHVLLDQSILSGIGNIYANEICFAMKINPFTLANTLTLKQVEELIKAAIEILNEAIKQGGTTIHSFSSLGIDGLFQQNLNVHLQKKCKVCGKEIIKDRIQGRSTYYCPICQGDKPND